MTDRRPQRDERPATAPGAPPTAVIVVGVDGSDSSWDALWWAFGEARRTGGRAVVVFVSAVTETRFFVATSVFAGAPCDYAAFARIATDEAEQLRGEVEHDAADQAVEVTFVHAHGDVAAELLRIAEEEHADVIVVGRSTKARHHLAGSLGRRLIGTRRAPVVVVVP